MPPFRIEERRQTLGKILQRFGKEGATVCAFSTSETEVAK
jgi:hypothetical protein